MKLIINSFYLISILFPTIITADINKNDEYNQGYEIINEQEELILFVEKDKSLELKVKTEKISVAIVDLEGKGIKEYEAQTLSDKLRIEIIKTGKFNVFERNEMNEILKEQGFQQIGCTSQECAIEIGQLIGVKYIITGIIGKVGKTFLLSLRLINVETGKIEKMVEEQVPGDIQKVLKIGIKQVSTKMAHTSIDYFNKGNNAFINEKYDLAIQYYTQAIDQNPEFENAYLNRGACYTELKISKIFTDSAILDFNKVLELNPNNADAYLNKGLIFHYHENYENAIQNFNKAIKIDPTIVIAWYYRGDCFSQIDSIQKAINDFTKVIEIDPKAYYAYKQRGQENTLLEKYKEAINDLTIYISAYPDDASIIDLRGDCYNSLKKYNKAIEDYSIAINIFGKEYKKNVLHKIDLFRYTRLFYKRGVAFKKIDKKNDAIKDFKKGIELSKNEKSKSLFYLLLGYLYKDLENYELSIKFLKKYISVYPKKLDVKSILADCYFHLNKCNNSIILYTEVLEKTTENFVKRKIYNKRGNAYVNKGEFEKALEDYNIYLGMMNSLLKNKMNNEKAKAKIIKLMNEVREKIIKMGYKPKY